MREMLEGLIARSERRMNETMLSAKAAEMNEEAKESLKREILEEVAKNCTKDKQNDVLGSNINLENATDFAKLLMELRDNVLTNTQREYDLYQGVCLGQVSSPQLIFSSHVV